MSEVRTLLEQAAKAAGITFHGEGGTGDGGRWITQEPTPGIVPSHYRAWNPWDDDGDALRLAATVGIHLEWSRKPRALYRSAVQASVAGHGHHALVIDYIAVTPEAEAEAAAAAAREAIVRAAAAYGASLP